MMKLLFVAAVLLAATAVLADEESDDLPNEPVILVQKGDAEPTFVVGADSNGIKLDRPPKPNRAPQIKPIVPVNQELKDTMKVRRFSDDDTCHMHHEREECIVDVSCGWCVVPEGGKCVPGTYAGPLNKTTPCPIYVTYQTELADDDDDGSSLWEPVTNSTGNPFNFSDALPLDQVETLDTEDDNTRTWPDPDQRSEWLADYEHKSSEHILNGHVDDNAKYLYDHVDADDTTGGQRKHNTTSNGLGEDHTMTRIDQRPVPVVMQPDAQSGFNEELSPCGLPGVPQFICMSWLKTHCGPDTLTDDAIKHRQHAANNAYDWCSMLFENEPDIYVGTPPNFPWHINGQRVPGDFAPDPLANLES